jgi:hypothetical protein
MKPKVPLTPSLSWLTWLSTPKVRKCMFNNWDFYKMFLRKMIIRK